jgi:hypothetical protein
LENTSVTENRQTGERSPTVRFIDFANRDHTLFKTDDKGQTIKIVGRYQQFRAVKLAVRRLLDGRNRMERSSIIWHTQGSGKSLTMMFMVRECTVIPNSPSGRWCSSPIAPSWSSS